MDSKITIITPTTGKNGLNRLIESLKKQTIPYTHILLWDDKREDAFLYPDEALATRSPYDLNCNNGNITYSIVVPGSVVQGVAAGSSLRSLGMLAATTPYVTFADDDVWYEEGHLESLLKSVEGKQWAYCKRKIWASYNDYIGVDNFESVGDSPSRKVPYEMVDNNTMIFARRMGTSAAVIYREVQEYNDDRQMYAFLKQYGGSPGKTDSATINQICPKKLEAMFRNGCTKE